MDANFDLRAGSLTLNHQTVRGIHLQGTLFAGKLTKQDSEDPDTVNHLNWYMSTGFTRPYPGENTVRPASEFNKAATMKADIDD